MSNFRFHRTNLVLIHIPKTGGVSIRKGYFGGHYEGPLYHIPHEWKHCYKFSFVRNPYDRLVSAWAMFRARGCLYSFEEFVDVATNDQIDFRMKKEKKRWGTSKQCIRHHCIPQLHPYNCLRYADYVGRYENLAEDFEKICDQFGLRKPELLKLNSSRHEHYSTYYSSELKQRVAAYYRQDLDAFAYDFVAEDCSTHSISSKESKLFCDCDTHHYLDDCRRELTTHRHASYWEPNILRKTLDQVRTDTKCEALFLRKLMVRLRRGAVPGDWLAFKEIFEKHLEYYLKISDTRTLLSILDTYIDHAQLIESKNSLLAVSFLNSEKLAQTKNSFFEFSKAKKPPPRELWSGMIRMNPRSGDMANNFFKRVSMSLSDTPIIKRVFQQMMREALECDYSTMAVLANRLSAKAFLNSYLRELCGMEVPEKRISAASQRRIIVIGLSKTGSLSLHNALKELEYHSVHFRDDMGRDIKQVVEENALAERKLLSGLEQYDAILDWSNARTWQLYQQLDLQYPDSKFIFLIRDLESWLESRNKHVKRNQNNPNYTGTWLHFDREASQKLWHEHQREIRNYFKLRSSDFLEMNITAGDGWSKLCPFLDLPIPDEAFPHKNAAAQPTQD